jgi:hypothetical protein
MRITSFVSLALTKVGTRQVPTTTIRVLSIQTADLLDVCHCNALQTLQEQQPNTNNYKSSFYTNC